MTDDPESVEVEVQYKKGHSYSHTYRLSDLHCPKCGEQTVWVERGLGDFYQGPRCVCLSCKRQFYLPTVSKPDYVVEQVVDQVRKARDSA